MRDILQEFHKLCFLSLGELQVSQILHARWHYQTAADMPLLTRAITSICSSVKLEQFLKLSKAAIFLTLVDFIFSCDLLLLINCVCIESLIFHIWLYHSSCYYYTVIQVT